MFFRQRIPLFILAAATFAPVALTQYPTLQTAAAAQAPAADQKPASAASTLSVEARLVNLPVIVRDKNGGLVQSLIKTDFTLQVDGHPQTIPFLWIRA